MSNLRIAGLRKHARRFENYGLSLQPTDARALVADIDALVATLEHVTSALENVLTHQGRYMTPADHTTRNRLTNEARVTLARVAS